MINKKNIYTEKSTKKTEKSTEKKEKSTEKEKHRENFTYVCSL